MCATRTEGAPWRDTRAADVPPHVMDKTAGRTIGDGKQIPAVGLGLYYTPPGAATYDIVSEALKMGYR